MPIEIEQCPAFKATDGSLHPTIEDAAAHSAQEEAEKEAAEYVDSYQFARGQKTRAYNVIVAFLKRKAGKEAISS